MTPKHIKEVRDKDDRGNDRRAIAPYNFVELPDVVVPAEEIPDFNEYHSHRHTGKIECVLTTDSPLYIRCGMTPENFAKFSGKDDDLSDDQKKQKRKIMADFFQYPTSQRPVLPGSSLRGMLRTLVEIAGYGKLTKVSQQQRFFFRAVAAKEDDPLANPYKNLLKPKNVKAGYLEQRRDRAASVIDFIPPHLRDPNIRDLAEAIFGFVQDEKQEDNQAQAGRVFIDDAICQQSINDDIWWTGDLEKTMTPLILASPKPTTFQHYLVQTNADKKELKHYGSEPEKETVIRGYKLYWHKGSSPSIKLPENQDVSDSQTTDIKPIKSGVFFKFTIHFENLSEIELGALLWVLNLAADPQYRLSLGMGKPLGMGAVKITHKLWLCERTNRYSKLFQNDDWVTGDNLATLENSEKCVNAFESHILNCLQEKGETSQKLEEVPRIKMLLAMLSFPGLSPDITRYMEIERDVNKPYIGQPKNGSKTVNEYQERPVLPTPLQVMEWPDNRIINNPPPSSQTQPVIKSKNPATKPKSPPKKRDPEGTSGTNLATQRPPQKPKR